MKNKFKEVFEKYYENLSRKSLEIFGSNPTISYNGDDNEIDREMIISKADEDGYSEWKIKAIDDYDFSSVEEKIGFNLCEELKAFYSSYLFLHLAGEYSKITLYFDNLKSKDHIEKRIETSQKDGNYYFDGTEILAIGSAEYKGDDAYVLFYDNKTGRIFIYENDSETKIYIDENLADLISKIDVIF